MGLRALKALQSLDLLQIRQNNGLIPTGTPSRMSMGSSDTIVVLSALTMKNNDSKLTQTKKYLYADTTSCFG